MTPVPAVWNFNLSACLRLDIWNASLECFIAQAICFTNLKYCDDGLNGDYNLYVGGSRVSFAFLGKCLAASKMQTFLGSLEQLTPRGPWSWVYLPAGKYHRWGDLLEVPSHCYTLEVPQKQKCPVGSTMLEKKAWFAFWWAGGFYSAPSSSTALLTLDLEGEGKTRTCLAVSTFPQ